jgi:hypothetical protein
MSRIGRRTIICMAVIAALAIIWTAWCALHHSFQ